VGLGLTYLGLLAAVIWLLRRLASRPPETEVDANVKAAG
jgi:hypothetical protein